MWIHPDGGSVTTGALSSPHLTVMAPTLPDPSNASSANAVEEPVRVFVVDDHPAIQEALAAAIKKANGLTVPGVAGAMDEALAAIESEGPDVVVLDLTLEGGNGFTLVEELRSWDEPPATLVYSMYEESMYAGRALRAGALGYVSKSAATEQVITAIRQVARGDVYLSEPLASQLLKKTVQNQGYAGDPVEQLTDRELVVFTLIGAGRSVREIAEELDLGRKTVETYRRRAKEKLGYETVDELLRFAVEWREKWT